MAYMAKADDPKRQPILQFLQFDTGRWYWLAICPMGCHPERQRKAYELETYLNRNTRGVPRG